MRWLLTLLLLLPVEAAWGGEGHRHRASSKARAQAQPAPSDTDAEDVPEEPVDEPEPDDPNEPAAGAKGSLSAAQKAYNNARYEKALRLLGESCRNSESPADCERLRGFIHVALGEADAARAAFDRMLAFDPNATLGPDVSPKLQAQFATAKEAMVGIQAMRVEKPEGQLGDTVLLEVKNPSSKTVQALVVRITRDGKEIESVPLRLQGEVWAGSWRVGPSPDPKPAKYFLAAVLTGGAQVEVGDKDAMFTLDWAGEGARRGEKPDEPAGEEGLPGWAPWVIGGGVAAAVAAAIITGVVIATQPPAPGNVQVNVVLHD